MEPESQESASDRLWREYSQVFKDFDNMSLTRWMAQTLGQLEGRVWRMSHPLIGCYRLAAQEGLDRHVWSQDLVSLPRAYSRAECCRAPLLPLFTREILETGLLCCHCSSTAAPFEELPADLKAPLQDWAERYAAQHEVAHWEESRRRRSKDYDEAYENAAKEAEQLWAEAAVKWAPKFLDYYPAIIWEDQDECLDVQPEDIAL